MRPFVLPLGIAFTLSLAVSSVSLAGAPSSRSGATQAADDATTAAAKKAIARELVTPLREREAHQGRFSRAYVPPRDRRVRLLETKADSKGKSFVSFAIDEGREGSSEDSWRKGALTGCVYPETGAVFVSRGEVWLPAGAILGKGGDAAAPEICRPASQAS